MTRAAVLLALLAALVAAGTADAAAARASLVDVEDEVMCVSCKIPLNVAESPQADRERDFIRERIAKGETKQQIKAELVTAYGRNVLALPDSGGFGITAYVVPLTLLALIGGGLVALVPRWRRRTPATAMAADDGPAPSRAETRRLDEELARYEQ